jgi:hypothetical protein
MLNWITGRSRRETAETTSASSAIASQLRLTTERGHPNINQLWRTTKDIEALKLDVKALAYELARTNAQRLAANVPEEPQIARLTSRSARQSDVESGWYRYWCAELGERPSYHRKQWEFVFVLQALYESGAIRPGGRMVGFGVGGEPLPAYLAGLGVDVLATDLSQADIRVPAGEHLGHRPVDMTALPEDLRGFDACWSCSTLCQLGSIAKGIEAAIQSVKTLKVGGVAVHTVEFNYANEDETIDNWGISLFQRRHFEQLAEALRGRGHYVEPLEFRLGSGLFDRFVDPPPHEPGAAEALRSLWDDGWQQAHLRASIDGFATTSFGIIIRREC